MNNQVKIQMADNNYEERKTETMNPAPPTSPPPPPPKKKKKKKKEKKII